MSLEGEGRGVTYRKSIQVQHIYINTCNGKTYGSGYMFKCEVSSAKFQIIGT